MRIQKGFLAISGLALGLCAASSAMAGDEKYPAHEFKPTVIYSNAELIAQTSGATATAPAAPTATAPASAASAPVAVASAAAIAGDPKFPAAYFTPVLLYPTK